MLGKACAMVLTEPILSPLPGALPHLHTQNSFGFLCPPTDQAEANENQGESALTYLLSVLPGPLE